MDKKLLDRLNKIDTHIRDLKEIESRCLELEASEKTLYAQLFLKAEGKSVAEREARVYASDEWVEFTRALVEAKTEYNYGRRLLDLKMKAYDGEHLTYKVETSAIQRGVG